MAPTAKEVGDKWGKLFGLAVDAYESHHDAHCTCDDPETHAAKKAAKKLPARKRRHRNTPDPNGEIGGVILTVDQHCPDSWTGTKGEVRVTYNAPAVTYLAPPGMQLLPATGPMASAAHQAAAPGDVPAGVNDVIVSLAALVNTLARGLYVGRLAPANGGNPDNPVLIYLDDVAP